MGCLILIFIEANVKALKRTPQIMGGTQGKAADSLNQGL